MDKEYIEVVRATIRACGFIIPMVALCVALFALPDVRDTVLGAVMGSASTASIFYFKKQEEKEGE